MTDPKISIIIPVYNVEKYVAEALDSCLEQSYKNIEIICIDDCGQDNSKKIIEEYALKDDRIKIITHEHNKEVSAARNSGIAAAQGEYLLYLDSDDWYEEGLFEKLIEVVNNNVDVNIIEFRFNTAIDKNNKIPAAWLDRGKSGLRLIEDEDIMLTASVWNKLYKKDFLIKNKLSFSEEIACFEDALYHLCAMLLEKKFYYLDFLGISWRSNPTSKTRAAANIFKNYMDEILMLDYLKSLLQEKRVYDEQQYWQFVIRIFSWSPIFTKKFIFHNDYAFIKQCYNEIRKRVKRMKMKKSDFKYKNDYNVYRRIKNRPFFIYYLLNKLKRSSSN